MTGRPDGAHGAEEDRIRAAYARRRPGQRYSWFDPAQLFLLQHRERRVLAALQRCGVTSLGACRILDVGCGTGYWIRELIQWGARPEDIVGVELLDERADEARRLSPASVRVIAGSAVRLGFPDASFDLVIQSTVFTSILDAEMRRRIATEMVRVVRPDGVILWYDYHMDNPANPDVRGVKEKELRALFPGCGVALERLTLAPPLARLLARRAWLLCELLERVPWLCTHHLAMIRRG